MMAIRKVRRENKSCVAQHCGGDSLTECDGTPRQSLASLPARQWPRSRKNYFAGQKGIKGSERSNKIRYQG